MKNQYSIGDTVDCTAPSGGVTSGNGVLIGSMFGIAGNTALVGASFPLVTKGAFTVSKVSAQAWTVGVVIYWDDSAKLFTTVSTSNTKVGVAILAAANPSATGVVRLNGSF